MADITVQNQGEVSDEGKVNWRGDQVTLPQGGQSIYKSSTIKLAELGERKVVGDRVFRYARAEAAITAGTLCRMTPTHANYIADTMGENATVGDRVVTLFLGSVAAKDQFAEGYMHVETGTVQGAVYRIKSHAATTSADVTVYLYDPIAAAIDTADLITLTENMYASVDFQSTNADFPVGVAPIACTTNDYFWLQTWGPAAVAQSTGVGIRGLVVIAANTGCVQAPVASTGTPVGIVMTPATKVNAALIFLQIAP